MIFYPAPDDVPVLILALVDKGMRDNLSRAERAALSKLLKTYTDDYRASAQRKIAILRRT